MMLNESDILFKNHVFTSQFYSDNLPKNKINLFAYLVQTKIWKLVYLFDLSNWKNKSSFEILSLDDILINEHYPENVKYHFCWKLLLVAVLFLRDCHLQWNSYSKSFILNSRTLSIFPALEKKKLVFVGKILWRFNIMLHLWLINLFFH